MKKLSLCFNCIGFLIQYIVPIILFGNVVPYTHDTLKKGLTGVGCLIVGVIAYIISKKVKEWVLQQPKSIWRGLVLSIFPVAWWLIIFSMLGWLTSFMLTFAQYWKNVLLFIIVGRAFSIASEALYSIEETDDERE